MKRPLLVVTVGYIMGIVWWLYCNCSIALLYAIIIPIYFLFNQFIKTKRKFKLFSFKRYSRYIKIFLKSSVIFSIIISSIISNLIVIKQNDKYDNLYCNKKDVILTGIVISNPTVKEYKTVYKLKVEALNGDLKYKNTYLLLNIKNNSNLYLEYGEKIVIKGVFLEPKTKRNYNGFDYKNFLKTKKIYGTVNASKVKVLDKECLNLAYIISNKAFLYIKINVQNVFPEKISNLILGIMLGYTDELDEDIMQNFRDSNMAHLLAVSGMHISYIIFGIITICNPTIGKRKGRVIIIIFLIVYMFITGFSPSVVRASIMGIAMILGKTIHKKNDIWNQMSLSLLCILMFNPFLITSLNVLLSYGGTIGIIIFNKTVINMLEKLRIKDRKYKYRINKRMLDFIKYLKETVAMSISVQIIIIPIMSVAFNTVGITFLLTNIFVSILSGPIIVLGFLVIISSFISVNILRILSFILSPILQSSIIMASVGSKLPLNKIHIATPNKIEIVVYYALAIIFNLIYRIYSKNRPTQFEYRIRNIISLIKYKYGQNKKKIILLILIICIILSLIKIFSQNLKIHFIDVGQGDSCLIITPMKHSILIDGGGSLNEEYDVGKNTLIPYLLDRRITKIDYIIISHFDQDHVGGLLTVMDELKVKKVLISKQGEDSENYRKFKDIVKEKKIKVILVEKGDRIKIEKNLYLDVLWPNSEKLISENALNNNSVVCKLYYKEFSMLFTGDIEEIAENLMLQEYKNNFNILNSTVLKVAHHGSKTSSSQEFIEAVKPRIALIGVGENNKFGHPDDGVLGRLQNMRGKNI